MLFKNLLRFFVTVSVASVLANPISEEATTALAKRGTVLSGQWDTESEVRTRLIHRLK